MAEIWGKLCDANAESELRAASVLISKQHNEQLFLFCAGDRLHVVKGSGSEVCTQPSPSTSIFRVLITDGYPPASAPTKRLDATKCSQTRACDGHPSRAD